MCYGKSGLFRLVCIPPRIKNTINLIGLLFLIDFFGFFGSIFLGCLILFISSALRAAGWSALLFYVNYSVRHFGAQLSLSSDR